MREEEKGENERREEERRGEKGREGERREDLPCNHLSPLHRYFKRHSFECNLVKFVMN